MLIDWFTVTAQVINFLILVWLLKRFLYQPILDAIDARENRIAAKIADAEEKKSEAQQQLEEYQRKNELFDQQRNALMNEAIDAAKAEHAQLLEAARHESNDLRARLQQAIRNEQLNLNEELSRRAREEVFAIARKVLSDLAGTSLEQRMTEIFIDRLRELDTVQISNFKSASNTSSNALRIRTAFDLQEPQKSAIGTAVSEMLSDQKALEFVTEPELVSGIELNYSGRKIAWSISSYLDSLAKSIDELLKNQSETADTALTDSAAETIQDADNNEH